MKKEKICDGTLCDGTFDPLDCHGHLTFKVGSMAEVVPNKNMEVGGSGQYATADSICMRCGFPAWQHKIEWRRMFHEENLYTKKERWKRHRYVIRKFLNGEG